MDDYKTLPDILSINQFCSMMRISRSRFYQILNEGLILPPVYSPDSKRPFFTKDIAIKNLEVKKNNIGVNGKICIFYNCRDTSLSSPKNNPVKKVKKKQVDHNHSDLIEGLSCLGIDNIKPSQVEEALRKCFPDGIDNVGEGEVLRRVFCLIKEQNSTDNQNR